MFNCTIPLEGAVHVHQAVCPVEIPSNIGSPNSLVAPASEAEILAAASVCRLAKLSLSGCACTLKAIAPTKVKAEKIRKARLREVFIFGTRPTIQNSFNASMPICACDKSGLKGDLPRDFQIHLAASALLLLSIRTTLWQLLADFKRATIFSTQKWWTENSSNCMEMFLVRHRSIKNRLRSKV